jgi:uncharacterized membrane-anchored protein
VKICNSVKFFFTSKDSLCKLFYTTTVRIELKPLLSMTMNAGYAISSIILISLFLTALVMQLISRKFHPVLYWSVILTTSTAGTTMSDYMDRTLGLGYAKGSLILVTCLMIVLAVWRFSEKTLSVSNIQTTKAELFYWVAILFSNTLGTALGDFLADDSGLGFLGGAIIVGGLIALIALASSESGRVVLARLYSDTPIWSDFRRLAHKTYRKRWAGIWHCRVVNDSRDSTCSSCQLYN